MASLLSAAVFVAAVQALAFDGKLPKPTVGVIPNPTFQLPEITIPPSVHELAKRQEGQTVLVGPDNTCGYVDGRPGAVYSCNGNDYHCALVTESGSGAVACCDNSVCGIRVDCIDYRSVYLSSACNNGCMQDTYTVKCTNVALPYCGTVTFFDGIVDYYCDTLSLSEPQQLFTTFSGESDGRTFTPVVVTLSGSEGNSGNTATTKSAVTSHTTQASSTDDTSDSSATGFVPSAGSDEDPTSSTAGSTAVPSTQSNSTTNIGAIVGGVVGGVVGLALIGLGIFFLVRHNKKKNAAAAPPVAGAPMAQTPGSDVPPAGGAAGYQQPYNPHYSTPPPPAGYYPGADQTKPGGFASVATAEMPDRHNSTSPLSQFTDNRQSSLQPTSPTSTINSTWLQQQQHQQQYPGSPPQQVQQNVSVPPTVHEAGGNVVGERDYNGNHHGQLHEMG
ncbi:hypothetical protein GGR54DRAFT_33180 [Hypoxylon sp. NC1633]|nr:hypothetical protein GGR54DRAFT_33180 [Hypoxylon sp. NC1633]